MAEKRNLLNAIFGKVEQKLEEATTFKLLSSWTSEFTTFNGDAWEIAEVRAAVNAFARNAAKVTPRHIVRGDGSYQQAGGQLDRLLQQKPNPYMSAYAFWYRVAAMYKLDNNAFIYPEWDGDKLVALYPIMARKVKLIEYHGKMYVEFEFQSQQRHTVPYSDIIHLRNYYYENDIFGANNQALLPVLQTAHKFNQSMGKFAELVSIIRGILKVQTAVKDSDLNKKRDDFVRDNMSIENNGSGIIVTDSKYDYQPINGEVAPIPDGQLKYVRDSIYNYFGVNQDIIQNTFTEHSWTAFYEGELEPFFIQLSQALTNGLFTDRERGFGNEILCEANRLQYASTQTKVAAATFLTNVGAATLDQICEMFQIAPIGGEEGKRRVQTLNMVNANLADKYQVGATESQAPSNSEKEDNVDNGNQ